MRVGIIGRKCGMSRVFTEAGQSIPVTVVEVISNRVTQIKTPRRDGYAAIQVTAGIKKPSRVNKPATGHFAKAGSEPGQWLHEFRLPSAAVEGSDGETTSFALGQQLDVQTFQEGQVVDVTAISKGKGFAGAVKRHNFRTQDATHGNSLSHRAPGSIGQCQTPGRVFKGKKMAGHMGHERCTVQNQPIVKIDTQRALILIKGAVPGAPGGMVVIMPAIKKGER